MRKNTQTMIKGTMMGILAGGALGAAGAYAAKQNPKGVRKMMKKATAGAEKAVDTLENMLKSY